MIGVLAAAKSTKGTHESRLKRVVRIYPGPEHSHGETGASILITPHQTGERVTVAGEDGSDQFRVR
jgi:hypothetical protein